MVWPSGMDPGGRDPNASQSYVTNVRIFSILFGPILGLLIPLLILMNATIRELKTCRNKCDELFILFFTHETFFLCLYVSGTINCVGSRKRWQQLPVPFTFLLSTPNPIIQLSLKVDTYDASRRLQTVSALNACTYIKWWVIRNKLFRAKFCRL